MLSCHLCLLLSCYSLVFWILSFDCSFCLIACLTMWQKCINHKPDNMCYTRNYISICSNKVKYNSFHPFGLLVFRLSMPLCRILGFGCDSKTLLQIPLWLSLARVDTHILWFMDLMLILLRITLIPRQGAPKTTLSIWSAFSLTKYICRVWRPSRPTDCRHSSRDWLCASYYRSIFTLV